MKINRRASEQGPMGDEIGGGNVIDGKENGRAIDGKELRVGQEMGWEGRIRKENAENTRRGSDTAKSADAREDRRPVMTQRSDVSGDRQPHTHNLRCEYKKRET
ncbi:hypothetical protein C8J57DRAFT_1219907 [Mycena rebaudengoi]|jgi:hypothetical protein|nr:hypothetical protein C8J57DRAFT_1219907 [Mycena rebaudengoi]